MTIYDIETPHFLPRSGAFEFLSLILCFQFSVPYLPEAILIGINSKAVLILKTLFGQLKRLGDTPT